MKRYLWKLAIRMLQSLVWRADEWLHAQEIKLREPAPAAVIARAAAPDPEFDVKASAARERIVKKARAASPRHPRLKYQHGEFVKVA